MTSVHFSSSRQANLSDIKVDFPSLPPANEVWGKVIFSEVCVKNSVHRGVCMVGGHAWLWGVCMVAGGACMVVGGCMVEGACVVAGGCAWLQGGMHGCRGHAWLLGGGMHGCQGAWLWGVCMVAGGCALLLGGVHGCRGHAWLLGGA